MCFGLTSPISIQVNDSGIDIGMNMRIFPSGPRLYTRLFPSFERGLNTSKDNSSFIDGIAQALVSMVILCPASELSESESIEPAKNNI